MHRAAELADLAGCPLHIFHVGCAASVREIEPARRRGGHRGAAGAGDRKRVAAGERVDRGGGRSINRAQPLRDLEDQEVLWQALSVGLLHVVSTDHCPWTLAEKDRSDFAQIPGGVPGIEARLALVHHFGVNRGLLSLERWVQVCSTNAARWMGLTTKGRIAPGYDADIVIFDPQREYTITPASLRETAGWTPYNGLTVTGWPRTVLLRGKVIVDSDVYLGQQGEGRFIQRQT